MDVDIGPLIYEVIRPRKPTWIVAPETQAVYFIIEQPFNGLVKIGFSKNPEQRLKQLQTGACHPLRIYRMIPTGTRALETVLHKQYQEYRRQGEWFELTLDQVDAIWSSRTSDRI